MPENNPMPRARIFLLPLSIFFYFTCSGQDLDDPAGWKKIDSGIHGRMNLQDIKIQLLGLKTKAIAEHNDAVLARCFADLLQINDLRSEDSLFLRNSNFMDSILHSSRSSALLKSIIHLLLARRMYEFETRFYNRKNKVLVRPGMQQLDYAAMDKKELDSLIIEHFDESIKMSKQLGETNTDELLWLSSNPLIFLFRPGYTDLLYGERVFMLRHNMVRNYDKHAGDWLSETPGAFIQNGEKIQSFNESEQVLYCYFQEWIQYHLADKPASAYFIETLARKYFYENLPENSVHKAAYEIYLNRLLTSPYNEVSAYAVYQLCKIWNAEAAEYNPNSRRDGAYYGNSSLVFDSSYRLHYNRILQLLDHFGNKLDSFSYLKTELLDIKAAILAPGLKMTTLDIQIPNSAIPVSLQYRNISHLYTRIIRIGSLEGLYPEKTININKFIKMPAIAEKSQPLILPDDHQWHNTFLKWDPLQTGRYVILYSDTDISNNPEKINFIELSVTNLAVINNDQRIFVLNRNTGMPVAAAVVVATIKAENKSVSPASFTFRTLSPKIVNNQGYVMIREKNISELTVYSGDDSITAWANEPENNIPDELYSKEKYDDLSDYYEENIHLNIFTDRSIYRPGQTVFYKGIFTVRHPKTGELQILDLQKLRFPFFENVLYKAFLTFKKPKIDITISDPFNKTVDSIKVAPNKFGSFSGSFLIPKDAATGEWDFDTEDYEMENQNSGKFQVEEYKRPTFKLILTKPKTELQLGDSFSVFIKTRSYAGAPLSHVRFTYHVSRSSHSPRWESDEILTGVSFSNESGEYNLLIRDSSLRSVDFPDDKKSSVEYQVEVEAMDETGETHEQDLNVNLSNRPVDIHIAVAKVLERNTMTPVYISMTNLFSGPVKKPVDICIYRLSQSTESDYDKYWPPADVWIFRQEEWQNEFPEYNFNRFFKEDPIKKLVYKTTLPAEADKNLRLPRELLTTGFYQIEAVCRVGGQIVGETSNKFSVYDMRENNLPGNDFEWLPANAVYSGDTLQFISGNKKNDYFSIYHMAYAIRGKNAFSTTYDYILRTDKKGLNEMKFKIPPGITGNLTLTHLYIIHNRIYHSEHRIQILNKKKPDPDIFIEKYRTHITPGEKETFTVSIRTGDPREAAELMTTMYDASLDELEPHHWEIPHVFDYYRSGIVWNQSITELQNNNLYEQKRGIRTDQKNNKPIWWISSPDFLPDYFNNSFTMSGEMYVNGGGALQGQVSGLSVQNYALNDVVVMGYGVSRREMTGTVTTVHTSGIKSLNEYIQPMIILDGVLFTGDINKINPASINQGIILKGADAVALYGNKAADGVLILSTHGPVILPSVPEVPLPPLLIRKNFAETAFFFPMIHAGKDGMYSFTFTLPETVTEWKWKLFAHTRNAGFAYLEKTLFSQLPLMVQPSIPRFLYQGDKLLLKTRITNLDSNDLAGDLRCTIEDLVTGENLTEKILGDSNQSFSIKHESNEAGSFSLHIPSDLLHPLRIRISAITEKFSDGEEHIVPILSKKFLLSQTIPVKSGMNIPLPVSGSAFPTYAEPYGLSLYINPKPQATLMNALSYLAFDPYGCSEQTLNKMLAYSMAIRISRRDSLLQPGISKILNTEKASVHDKDEPEPNEQTMPWLQLRHANIIQQQKLRQLFDTVKSKQAFEKQLNELTGMQKEDGGLSWFKGGRTNEFISAYVLAGLGKMRQDELLDPGINSKEGYAVFQSRLIQYADSQLVKLNPWADPIPFLYARSYWIKDFPVSESVRLAADSSLKKIWSNISYLDIDQQATLIIISLRFAGKNEGFRDRSLQQLESIRQLAISDSLYGVRWKAVSNTDDPDRQGEEIVARIAEAFETAGRSGDMINGIVQWLLKTKSDHVWSGSKSTAAIVGFLQVPDLSGVTHQLTAKAEDSVLTVTDDLFAGRSTDFIDLSGKKFPPQISISSDSPAPVSGGIKYYYFSSIPPVDSANGVVQIYKTLYRYDTEYAKWEPVNEKTTFKIADKIKTVITLRTARQLNYVFINERRAAAMEPLEPESGYQYGDGLEYYQSVKDAGYLFFIDKIPSGLHSISYETVISASGSFTNGPASLQCMYQPSVNVYSNTANILVNR